MAFLIYEDGTPISDDDFKQLREAKKQAMVVVDECPRSAKIILLTTGWMNINGRRVRIQTKGLDSAIRAPTGARVYDTATRSALSEPRYLVCGGCVARCGAPASGSLPGYGPAAENVDEMGAVGPSKACRYRPRRRREHSRWPARYQQPLTTRPKTTCSTRPAQTRHVCHRGAGI